MWWIENDSEIIESLSHFSLQGHCIREQCLSGCKFWKRPRTSVGSISEWIWKCYNVCWEVMEHHFIQCPIRNHPPRKQDTLYTMSLKAMGIFFNTCPSDRYNLVKNKLTKSLNYDGFYSLHYSMMLWRAKSLSLSLICEDWEETLFCKIAVVYYRECVWFSRAPK